ncbi:MAG: hypothetical protein M0Z51_15630 [Propionibacterium sp.]|nr:hypothetical protein [Propionibacterium sp.]
MPTSTPTELATRTGKLSIQYGRQYELDKDQTGTLQIDCRNDDGLLSDGAFQPTMPVQVTATYSGTTYDLFTGFWESMPWENPSPLEGTAQLAAQDLFGAFAQRTLSSTMTEYVMSATTPDLYMPLSSPNPIVGVSGGAALYTSGPVLSSFGGSFGGDTAFRWHGADKAGVTGKFNTAGGQAFPKSTQWHAVIGFTTTGTLGTDQYPILSLLDNSGNPVYILYYSSGILHFTAYTGDNTSASSSAYAGIAGPYADTVGEHVVMIGHDGTNISLAVDGGTPYTAACPWLQLMVMQWAVGTPVYTLGASPSWSGWYAIGPTGSTASPWNAGSAIDLYGFGLYMDKGTPAFSWGSIVAAESAGTAAPVTDVYAAAESWAGMSGWHWTTDNTQVIWQRPAGNSLLQWLQDAVASAEGRVYVDGAGNPVILNRDTNQIPGAIKWKFGRSTVGLAPSSSLAPSPSLAPSAETYNYPYTGSPKFAYDLTRVYSDVTVTTPAHVGYAQVSAVPYAQRRSWAVSSNAVDAQAEAGWLLGRYSSPTPRPAAITFEPSANAALWPMVLGIALGDYVELVHHVPGQPDIDMLGFVESISHQIDANAGTWTTTIQMSPDLGRYWVMGDAVYSVMGSTTKLGWRTT